MARRRNVLVHSAFSYGSVLAVFNVVRTISKRYVPKDWIHFHGDNGTSTLEWQVDKNEKNLVQYVIDHHIYDDPDDTLFAIPDFPYFYKQFNETFGVDMEEAIERVVNIDISVYIGILVVAILLSVWGDYRFNRGAPDLTINPDGKDEEIENVEEFTPIEDDNAAVSSLHSIKSQQSLQLDEVTQPLKENNISKTEDTESTKYDITNSSLVGDETIEDSQSTKIDQINDEQNNTAKVVGAATTEDIIPVVTDEVQLDEAQTHTAQEENGDNNMDEHEELISPKINEGHSTPKKQAITHIPDIVQVESDNSVFEKEKNMGSSSNNITNTSDKDVEIEVLSQKGDNPIEEEQDVSNTPNSSEEYRSLDVTNNDFNIQVLPPKQLDTNSDEKLSNKSTNEGQQNITDNSSNENSALSKEIAIKQISPTGSDPDSDSDTSHVRSNTRSSSSYSLRPGNLQLTNSAASSPIKVTNDSVYSEPFTYDNFSSSKLKSLNKSRKV